MQADFIPGFARIKKGLIASAFASVNIYGAIGLRSSGALDMLLAVKPRSGGHCAVNLKGSAGRPDVSIELAGSVLPVIGALESAGGAVLKKINSGRKGQ